MTPLAVATDGLVDGPDTITKASRGYLTLEVQVTPQVTPSGGASDRAYSLRLRERIIAEEDDAVAMILEALFRRMKL